MVDREVHGPRTQLTTSALSGEALLAAIVRSSDDAIFAQSADGTVLVWNRAAEAMYGYRADQIIGRNADMLVPADELEELDGVLERLSAGERASHLETRRRRRDGTLIDVSVAISPLLGPAGRVVGSSTIARDITERKHLERLLTHKALHDPLTGLPNRILLEDRLQHALAVTRRSGRQAAVLFADLDVFKSVNDRHGHIAGDQVLMTLAHRMRATVRPSDTVGRFGGDEFLIVCPDIADRSEAEGVGERVRASVAEPIVLGGHEVRLSASIGIALGVDGDDPSVLIRRADTAMYSAKSGRPRQV